MNGRDILPMLLSANDIQAMDCTRTMAYNILNSKDVPVVKIAAVSLSGGISFPTGLTARRTMFSRYIPVYSKAKI